LDNLFGGLITSKTRIKLLIRLFTNPEIRSYLRELSREFNVSSNSVREELNQLTDAKLLNSFKNGRQILYSANKDHPLFPELKAMVKKVIGMDKVIENIVSRLGKIEEAYLIDDYAEGKDTGIIDLLLVGQVDGFHLSDLSNKTERYINRKIRFLVLSREEFIKFQPVFKNHPKLLVWEQKDA
jgi:hypothetical protein